MKKTIWMTFALITLLSVVGSSQKVKLTGKLDFLKGVKKVELAYKYDNMGVGKFKTNDEYVAKKTKEYNEKEAGKGDDWAKKWVSDRETRYQPHFEQSLKEHCPDIDFDENNKSDYKMTVETVFTEPGFNVGVMRKNASINIIVYFTDKSGKELAKMAIDNIPGRDAMGYDYDTGVRIEEAYEKAGKTIGKFIDKNIN